VLDPILGDIREAARLSCSGSRMWIEVERGLAHGGYAECPPSAHIGTLAENAFAAGLYSRPRQFLRMLQEPAEERRGGRCSHLVSIAQTSNLGGALEAEFL